MTLSTLWVLVIVSAIIYLTVLIFLARRITLTARRTLTILMVIIIIVGYLYTRVWQRLPGFERWLYDPNSEYGIGSTLSAILLFIIGGLTLSLGGGTQDRIRVYWFFFGAAMTLMAVDEYYALHEPYLWATLLYTLTGMILAAIPLILFWFERTNWHWLLLALGFAGMAFGGVFWDYVIVEIMCHDPVLGVGCHKFYLVEEFYELWGTVIIVATLVSLVEKKLPETTFKRLPKTLGGATTLFTLVLLFSFWALPGIEARYSSEKTQVQIGDVDSGATFDLIGYRISDAQITPGESLKVTLYWRANQTLPRDYGVSAHLLNTPEHETLAETDNVLGQILSSAWIPGVVMKQNLWLDIPTDLPTPRSYRVAVTLWYTDEYFQLNIPTSDRPTIGESAFVLLNLPAPPVDAPPTPPNTAVYHFAGGFSLIGYELPDQAQRGEEVRFAFWWQADQSIQRDLTQFLHLVPSEGDFTGFDRPPFGGSFPIYDWPAGMSAVDEWMITLPVDMPPGTYQVFTGMYDWASGERQPISDADGQPIADQRILLGSLTISE